MANNKKNAGSNTWPKAINTKTVNAEKAAKLSGKPIDNEQIEEEKARLFLEKEEAAKKIEADAEAQRIEEEKAKALAEKETIKQAKLAEQERNAEAKRIAAEKIQQEKLVKAQQQIDAKKAADEAKRLEEKNKMFAEIEARNKEDEIMEKQANKNKKKVKNEDVIVKEVKEIEVFDTESQFEINREFIELEPKTNFDKGVKGLKQKNKYQKQLANKYSKKILTEGAIVTTTNCKPSTEQHIIELKDVRKSYITGDLETPILKGIDVKLDKGDFIVILGPSGSGKTTFLNVISGLDKATEGDVFILGSNLSLLKDSHLTKFRRRNVGFIFQQYNLLTNLTSKENAEVGQNLANKNKQGMSIEDIFETIGMKEQMNKYPHQMSGGQQQRVSIARALAKNPEILFADEPTGALDEEMGRKVLEILVKVNREQKTTVVVVTHNPNIAKIANTVIHIKNGLIDSLEKNKKPADPKTIEWS